MKVSIEMPFFPGFYESSLENSDTSYWAIKEELEYYYQQDLLPEHPEYAHLTENDLDFDYQGYEKDVIDNFVEGFADRTPDFVENVEFDEMVSPKYYNFATDKVYVSVELRDGWEDDVKAFMTENADWLRKRIEDDWTSYDGFMSFMSNNFDDRRWDDDEDGWGRDKSWYWHLFSGKSDRWECYLSTIIAYMMYRENSNIKDDLVMIALEEVYTGSYVYITEDAKQRLQEMIDNGEVTVPDPAQLKIPFDFQ